MILVLLVLLVAVNSANAWDSSTEAPSDVQKQTLALYGQSADVFMWVEGGQALLRIVPTTPSIFVCSTNFQVLQNGQFHRDVKLANFENGSPVCSNISNAQTMEISYWENALDPFITGEQFQVLHNGFYSESFMVYTFDVYFSNSNSNSVVAVSVSNDVCVSDTILVAQARDEAIASCQLDPTSCGISYEPIIEIETVYETVYAHEDFNPILHEGWNWIGVDSETTVSNLKENSLISKAFIMVDGKLVKFIGLGSKFNSELIPAKSVLKIKLDKEYEETDRKITTGVREQHKEHQSHERS